MQSPFNVVVSAVCALSLMASAEATAQEPTVSRLRADLASDDADLRETAVLELGTRGAAAKAALPDLVGALKDSSGLVREAAVRALGQLAPHSLSTLPHLLALRENTDLSYALAPTMWSFSRYAPEAAACLEHLLLHANIEIAFAAIEGVSELGPLAAARCLPLLLQLPDEGDRRLECLTALEELGPGDGSALLAVAQDPARGYDVLEVVDLWLEAGHELTPAVPALLLLLDRDLTHADVETLADGRALLVEFGDLSVLLPALADPRPRVREQLCTVLGNLGPPESVVPVLRAELATSDSAASAGSAVLALLSVTRAWDPAERLEHVTPALSDPRPRVRMDLAFGLVFLAEDLSRSETTPLVPALGVLLADSDPSIRHTLLLDLPTETLAHPGLASALAGLLGDPSKHTRKLAGQRAKDVGTLLRREGELRWWFVLLAFLPWLLGVSVGVATWLPLCAAGSRWSRLRARRWVWPSAAAVPTAAALGLLAYEVLRPAWAQPFLPALPSALPIHLCGALTATGCGALLGVGVVPWGLPEPGSQSALTASHQP